VKTILIFIIIITGIGVWFLVSKSSDSQPGIIARNGLHWHANLNINILGEVKDIPAGIGLARLPHNPIHTHDRDNVIHLEFAGLVREDDLRLGRFFEIWGQKFNQDCVSDKCTGPEGTLKVLINGKENFEFENYIMRDDDKIEIIFEAKALDQIEEITITGTEFSFKSKNTTLKAGEKVKLIFKNEGGMPHNLTIEGLGLSTKTIGGGKTDTIEFTAPTSGTYNIFCSVPGHRESGMTGQLIIIE